MYRLAAGSPWSARVTAVSTQNDKAPTRAASSIGLGGPTRRAHQLRAMIADAATAIGGPHDASSRPAMPAAAPPAAFATYCGAPRIAAVLVCSPVPQPAYHRRYTIAGTATTHSLRQAAREAISSAAQASANATPTPELTTDQTSSVAASQSLRGLPSS